MITRRDEIQIPTRDGWGRSVTATICDDLLAYHQTTDPDTREREGCKYTITHTITGYAIALAPSWQRARKARLSVPCSTQILTGTSTHRRTHLPQSRSWTTWSPAA